MNDFRFSPRANRAAEIGWMPWGQDAFSRAAAEDKPILLSISAVWCHWCHVMDETSYSDPGVIEAINRRFVPVRVDNDRRPDINARYNMGGWPTTAFLAPDGTTLTGATYLPPEQMRNVLEQIASFYAEHKSDIAARTVEPQARPAPAHAASEDLDEAPILALLDDLRQTYDPEFGGFGDTPKFPQPEVAEFLLAEWRRGGDPELYAMVAKTMLAMARGGMYDHVEGGFFRYSTTRDWSVPHFEKMAEDHAGLLRVLAGLVMFAPDDEFRATLVSAIGYVRPVLRDPATGFFAGSQDADESYFALPLDERRARAAPFVDRTSYTNWTCALAGAECLVAQALDDDVMLAEALQTLDNVHERLLGSDGLLFHVLQPGGEPELRGLLTDQVAYARALLDAHEISGETRFLERARALCDVAIARFASVGAAFYDRIPSEDAFGRLAIADRPIVDNGLFADVLLRLAALLDQPKYREPAQAVLRSYRRTSERAGPFAATYARALRRYLSPEVTVRIVGEPAATGEFRETAARLPAPFAVVRTLLPRDAAELSLPPQSQPAAYVCSAQTCGAPVCAPADLRAAYDALIMPHQVRT
jgi:uncharacterized protein YyaL (SSP411 family)